MIDRSGEVLSIETEVGLAGVADRAARAERIAVDVESNGLFVYRPALCVLQMAWPEDGAMVVAVVDTLATSVAPLARLFGEGGPIKVLHDLTFDARLLAEAGAPLARVRDTSVAARLLGHKATGLSALLATELGVHHDKRLQQHDWTRRPLRDAEIDYLAGDVRHLLALDERLEHAATAIDVEAEIADECTYKLTTALSPRQKPRPGYVRVKGAAALDAIGRAVLRRVWLAREAAAAKEDVPPFKVTSNEALLEVAQKRPASMEALRRIRGALAGLAGRHAAAWLAAVAEGLRDGDTPEEERALWSPAPPSREEIARRRARESQVSAWRKVEAAQRGVDEQAVLPGHCAEDLVEALAAHDARPDEALLREAIAQIPGLGSRRRERYGDVFVRFSTTPPGARPSTS
ncbi:Ribonuclease D [Minicystis rosea]|nr:Ribonuclease D [Minicystis rosea]